MTTNDDILAEFLAECWENLGHLDTEIVELETDPTNEELLASIFRTIHTIKGNSGFFGLNRLGAVAHSAENILGKMREGELAVTSKLISLVLRAVDQIKAYLMYLDEHGTEGEFSSDHLIAVLDEAAVGENSTAPSAAEPAVETKAPVEPVAEETAESVGSPAEPVIVEEPADAEAEPGPASLMEEPEARSSRRTAADLSIRVNVDVLDRLMNLVGELVLTRNQLLQLVRGEESTPFSAPITSLNRVTTDLQEGVMKTRMQPIGTAWAGLPRIVRDLEQVTGKSLKLVLSGAETELDRTILEAIRDPLTHLVRNAADHGIESAEDRKARSKPETGTIRLSAEQEGGHVVITLEDDGGGIDPKVIARKAVQRGLLTERQARELPPREILACIFEPGFSTAEQVSSVSGRGVGMDVVKTQIERIGGMVDLNSVPGAGVRVHIRIPLTLAIISALVVDCRGMAFAIPQLGIVELVRLDPTAIETIHDQPVFRLRDRLLPLVDLSRVIGLDEETSDTIEKETDAAANLSVVVVQVEQEQFGLVVSEVFDTQEIVVKPVGRLLKSIGIYQGTTILGDGRVIMILDVGGIAAEAGSFDESTKQTDTGADDSAAQLTTMLLFSADDNRRMAVPLSLVSRLEEFDRSDIETCGDRTLVQYRGHLLPLEPIEGVSETDDRPTQPVIVFSEDDHAMGLMVSAIEDIRPEHLDLRLHSDRKGLLGTAIINGRATDIIDTRHYLLKTDPNWFDRKGDTGPKTVLVVDDSLFFRQLLKTTLEASGYQVRMVGSADEILEQAERGLGDFDAIVSDLEMPGLDGFGLAEWLRSREETVSTPLIALSSLAADHHIRHCTEVGFDRHLIKFDSDVFLSTLRELIREANTQPAPAIGTFGL